MKNRFTLIMFLLLVFLLNACSINQQSLQNDVDSEKTQQTVTEETEIDSFEKVRESEEDWLAYGLSAYESGKEITDLSDFFTDITTLHYLTLYDHLFEYDKEKYIPFAEALFAFIYEEYGADALLDIDKRCEYKTAFLKSFGVDMEYIQSKEIETFFATMKFSSNALYKYIMTFDNVTYYLKDIDSGAPQEYHGFLFYSTTGLFELIDYLKENNLSDGLDTERDFKYYVLFDEKSSHTSYSSGDMYINNSDITLHEAMHAMGVTTLKNEHIWLSEGICDYFCYDLGFNDLIASRYVQIFQLTEQGYYDEKAESGDPTAVIAKATYVNYLACGGKFDTLDSIDFRLYADVYSRLEFEMGKYTTIGDTFEQLNNKKCPYVGSELSYQQAHSMICYLVDVYGIENVMNAYHTQDLESSFGKDYEALKTDWLTYLG
ncbi:MAG: hypothetical protein E7477_04770 [Ruminococcaceae bacterium]|nr:hypothetical protein [Oscillospiraceae bacterium]